MCAASCPAGAQESSRGQRPRKARRPIPGPHRRPMALGRGRHERWGVRRIRPCQGRTRKGTFSGGVAPGYCIDPLRGIAGWRRPRVLGVCDLPKGPACGKEFPRVYSPAGCRFTSVLTARENCDSSPPAVPRGIGRGQVGGSISGRMPPSSAWTHCHAPPDPASPFGKSQTSQNEVCASPPPPPREEVDSFLCGGSGEPPCDE
jgi:hypothetical protein